ncbi:MAG: class F sortase [Acidimicrobiales bacterium]
MYPGLVASSRPSRCGVSTPQRGWRVWVLATLVTAQAGAGVVAATVVGSRPAAANPVPGPGNQIAEKLTPTGLPAPLSVRIPSIGVTTGAIGLGLAPDGSLEAPGEYGAAGWWTGGTSPGQPGPAVIVGHFDSYRGPAVFFRLSEVEAGDIVSVENSDRSESLFVVERVASFSRDGFPTKEVYGPTAESTLRLITCGGRFDRKTRSYTENVVVFARMIAPA